LHLVWPPPRLDFRGSEDQNTASRLWRTLTPPGLKPVPEVWAHWLFQPFTSQAGEQTTPHGAARPPDEPAGP